MMQGFTLLALAVPFSCLLGPILGADTFVPDHVLRVTARNITLGCASRYSLLVNGTYPGPELRLKPIGAQWIRVFNDMIDTNLSMHWHGLPQRTAQYSDGPAMLTQWPIAPQQFHDYKVEAFPEDAGTYMYHSHLDLQATTAIGPLVVEDDGSPPYEYDEERVFFLSEYFDKTDETMLTELETVPYEYPGPQKALMLNGKTVPSGFNVSSSCQLPTVDIEAGKTYRFRFVGAGALNVAAIGIENHNLTIIAVDGSQYTQPHTVDYLAINLGQRYDVLFTAKTTEELADAGTSTFSIQIEPRGRANPTANYGVLRYVNTDIPAPDPLLPPAVSLLTLPTDTYNFLEPNILRPLVPAVDFPTYAEVTRRLIFRENFFQYDDAGNVYNGAPHRIYTINNRSSFTERYVHTPLLVDIYNRGEAAMPNYTAAMDNGGYDEVTGTYPVQIGEVLEIVWQGTSDITGLRTTLVPHSFHHHGQHVFHIGSGSGTYDPEAAEAAIAARGVPIQRDTVSLHQYPGDAVIGPDVDVRWVAVRLRVEQPGPWLAHCHVLAHMNMGMQVVFVHGTAAEILAIPSELSEEYRTFGGSVHGQPVAS